MLATVEARPEFAELGVLLVWVPMLLTDSAAMAAAADGALPLEAVRFGDPDRTAAGAVAAAIGAPGETAWDMYLFFQAGTAWETYLPAPLTWVHQLHSTWADRSKMALGPDLFAALVSAAATTLD